MGGPRLSRLQYVFTVVFYTAECKHMLANSIGHTGSEFTSGSKLAHDVGMCALHANMCQYVVFGHVFVQWVLMMLPHTQHISVKYQWASRTCVLIAEELAQLHIDMSNIFLDLQWAPHQPSTLKGPQIVQVVGGFNIYIMVFTDALVH